MGSSGSKSDKPWRDIHFEDFNKTADFLKADIEEHTERELKLVLVGQTGAGKSSFINSMFSVSRGRITSKVNVKTDTLAGVGTRHYLNVNAESTDLFRNVTIFDTMGFTSIDGTNDKGITLEDLKAVCEGRMERGHEFKNDNKDNAPGEVIQENRPHCIIYVVSAEDLTHVSNGSDVPQIMKDIYTIVPKGVAKIAVLTKVDKVCDQTNNDIQRIYKSAKVEKLVKQVHAIYGVNENEVFPVVNLVKEVKVEKTKTVPLMYAISFALYFAKNRQEMENDDKPTKIPSENL